MLTVPMLTPDDAPVPAVPAVGSPTVSDVGSLADPVVGFPAASVVEPGFSRISVQRSGVNPISPRAAVLALACLGVLAAACEKVPLLAPTGSTITLTASTPVISANGTAQIVAQVIEAAGTPPHSGTHITFTTSLGTIQPSDAETDVNGRAIVTFVAGNNNGMAIITASSGGATTGTANALRLAVGSAAVGRVAVIASPASVPAIGGSVAISATVLDVNGNPLTSTPVQFSTTAGALSSAIVSTDSNGNASTILITSQQATVTATVGAQAPPPSSGGGSSSSSSSAPSGGTSSSGTASGSVTVTVSNAPTIVITPPTTPPSVGLPASFTFAITAATSNGSAVRDVTVDWGDGTSQDLGAVTGNAVVAHIFTRTGSFPVTATVTDAAGNRTTVSTVTSVIPVARPTVLVTPTPTTVITGGTINFTIQITAPPGIGIIDTTIDFGDGQSSDLGGATSATVSHPYHPATVPANLLVTVTVRDTAGNVTTGTTSVSVTP
jgi:PKD domain/Bacterial Ig-like domain (group 1)